MATSIPSALSITNIEGILLFTESILFSSYLMFTEFYIDFIFLSAGSFFINIFPIDEIEFLSDMRISQLLLLKYAYYGFYY